MIKRLNSSAEIKRYASQFVTAKISSSGSDFSEIHSAYSSKGDKFGIPYMYLVRSDGTRIWSGGASMEVSTMAKILAKAISEGGVAINESQAAVLVNTKAKIEALQEEGDIAGAVTQLRKVSKFGPVGAIPSFATAAVEMNELGSAIVQDAAGQLEPIVKKLEAIDAGSETSSEADSVTLLNEFLEFSDVYASLKPVKPQFSKAKKLIKDSDELNAIQRDLRSIRSTQSAKAPSSIEKAIKKLELIVERRQSGAVVDLVTVQIAELNKKLAEK